MTTTGSGPSSGVRLFATKNPVLRNRFMPLILLVLNCLLFFGLLPDSVRAEYTTLLAILGGIVTMILLFWTLVKLVPALVAKFLAATVFVSVLSVFAFGFLFISRASDFASRDLAQNGEPATARIVDKTRILGRRGQSSTSIRVAFRTKAGGRAEASILVPESVYGSISEGMEIPVLYSAKNPGIAEIAYDKTVQYHER